MDASELVRMEEERREQEGMRRPIGNDLAGCLKVSGIVLLAPFIALVGCVVWPLWAVCKGVEWIFKFGRESAARRNEET